MLWAPGPALQGSLNTPQIKIQQVVVTLLPPPWKVTTHHLHPTLGSSHCLETFPSNCTLPGLFKEQIANLLFQEIFLEEAQ